MERKKFLGYFYFILFINTVYSSILTNICPSSPSCNCTLTNNTDLDIICNSTLSLTDLPKLSSNTYQLSATQLRMMSSTNTKGPLISLPTNICSYPNLAILDLSLNNINGLLNTSELACLSSTLTYVDFSYNNINDIGINLFKSNPKIQIINLSYNNLTSMPTIDANTFVNFPSSIVLMNFSYNQILNVDLWPLFVRTGKLMTIDMSNNLIKTYTNNIPISIEQFSETPDPRYFYLNNNQIPYLSDLVLEEYGACTTSTINPISTAIFIVGISNVLLTNNPLRCDCESYNLITYLNDGINDFPQINNGTALITKATCSSPSSNAGQQYISTSFTDFNDCVNYTLPNITNIFCSQYVNDTTPTLPTPTYWPTTVITTTVTSTYQSSTGTMTGSTESSNRSSSTSVSWYIILGVVLGLAVVLAIIVAVCYLFRDKLIPKKFRSKFLNHVRTDGDNPNNSYEPIIRNSEVSQKNLRLNGIKPQRASMATSACGFDDQEHGTNQSDDNGSHSGLKSSRDPRSWNDGTQTNFHPNRSKPPTGRPHSTRGRQPLDPNDSHNTSHRERKLSLATATDVGTNTTNIVKGIPIGVPNKIPSIPSNGTDKIHDTSTSELGVVPIPLTPSKRAKPLPQVKNAIYVDSTNENLLNTSAGAHITSQRQRRRSSMWFRKQNQNMISPLPTRPQSMVAQKTIFDYNGSFDEDFPSIPTIESLTNKPSKPIRTVPLLNISVVSAWGDDSD